VTFNLEPPAGFRGLDPDQPMKIYHRNLPHWRQDGATYFVTFNLADALPAEKRNELNSMRREWELQHPPPRGEQAWSQYAKSVFRKVEKWMDAGCGVCWFQDPFYAAELHRCILHFQQEHYDVGCFVIMANHCHLVIRPFSSYELEDEIGVMKSISAKFVLKHEAASGPLWQQESYDRIVRDAEHLWKVVQYIGRNPRAAHVDPSRWHRWLNPLWEEAGWRFLD